MNVTCCFEGKRFVFAFIVQRVVELHCEDGGGREKEHHHHEDLVHALVVSIPKSVGLKKRVQGKRYRIE